MKKKYLDNVISLNSIVTSTAMLKMSQEIESLKQKHQKTREMAARSILYALDLKDHYTFGHSTRVAYFSLELGKKLNLSKEDLHELELASLFHDIGKIGIPDQVLNKPERLEMEEFTIMKQHPEKSYEILQQFGDFEKIAICTRHHHERYDGRGYPSQLKGEEIPLFSRIILISDTFDAMTSTRSYRKGLSYQMAIEELRQFSGTQFDPQLVEIFSEVLEEIHEQSEDTFELSIIEGKFRKDAA